MNLYCRTHFLFSMRWIWGFCSGVTPMGSGWANPRAPGLRGHPQGAPSLKHSSWYYSFIKVPLSNTFPQFGCEILITMHSGADPGFFKRGGAQIKDWQNFSACGAHPPQKQRKIASPNSHNLVYSFCLGHQHKVRHSISAKNRGGARWVRPPLNPPLDAFHKLIKWQNYLGALSKGRGGGGLGE